MHNNINASEVETSRRSTVHYANPDCLSEDDEIEEEKRWLEISFIKQHQIEI